MVSTSQDSIIQMIRCTCSTRIPLYNLSLKRPVSRVESTISHNLLGFDNEISLRSTNSVQQMGLQLPSECWTNSVFQWSKHVRSSNGLVFKWHLKTGYFFNVGTPSAVHPFEHFLWSIFQSSIFTHNIIQFFKNLGPPRYQANMLPTELSWLG